MNAFSLDKKRLFRRLHAQRRRTFSILLIKMSIFTFLRAISDQVQPTSPNHDPFA